jgi:hypothetical protein
MHRIGGDLARLGECGDVRSRQNYNIGGLALFELSLHASGAAEGDRELRAGPASEIVAHVLQREVHDPGAQHL